MMFLNLMYGQIKFNQIYDIILNIFSLIFKQYRTDSEIKYIFNEIISFYSKTFLLQHYHKYLLFYSQIKQVMHEQMNSYV